MDEVLRIKKDLDKVNNDTKQILDLLKCLETIPMTLDVLKRTQIGMSVNKIRKSVGNTEVNSLSKSMIKKWKKLLSSVGDQPTASNSNSVSMSSSGDKTDSKSETTDKQANSIDSKSFNTSPAATHIDSSSNANANSSNNTISSSGILESPNQPAPYKKRHAEDIRVPTSKEAPYTSCEVRLKCRTLIADALRKPLPQDFMNEPFLDEEALSSNIEESIFQEFKKTDMKYKNRIRSRVSNLGDTKNPYLRWNVLKGDISAEKIAKMTAEEMASDELKRQREKFTKEAINDHQMSLTTGTKTSEIKCPACKKYDVTYNQVQTRSADEPMTTFCYCNQCGKRWKFC